MKQFTTFLIFVAVAAAGYAQNIRYTLLRSNQSEAVVRVEFGTYHTETVTVDGTEMQTLHSEDAYPILKEGSPELLQAAFSLIVPEGSQPTAEVIDAQFSEVANFALAPSKGKLYRNVNPTSIPYVKNADYQSEDYLLGSAATTGEVYQLRDYHGINVKVFPFDYNPTAQTLKAYSSITVKVHFNSGRSLTAAEKNNRTFDAIYRHQFLNYGSLRGTLVAEEGGILIIAPENFIPAMQPYVDWKIRNGFPTEIVPLSTAGNNATAIKNYISTYYNEHNLAFVIIVGDNAQFPTPTLSGNKSDNYFTELVGNDSYPDIILGKISAETVAHVETQVQRFIEYEQNPSDTGHFPVFMGIASNQGPGDNNEYDYQHIRNIDNKLQGYTYTSGYEFFEGSQGGLDASGNPTANMVATAVNSGVGIISYCGHGDVQMWVTSNFTNSNVNSLTNVGKLPFILSVACVNGEYHTGTCFAEAWLRATNSSDGEPTGAVSMLASTINQPWNSPMCAQDRMIDLLVGTTPGEQYFTYGGIVFNGMIHMLDVYNDVEVFRTWLIFGDPTLLLRTAVPQNLEVNHDTIIPVGIPSITFSSPVENAKITITKDGEIVSMGHIQNGEYTLDFQETYLPTDTLHVLATAPNYLPYEGIVNFIPNDGPYVIVSSLPMTEYHNPWITYYENGLAEYGETMLISPELVNLGNATANNLRIKVTSDDEYITLNNSEIYIDTLAAHDTVVSANTFSMTVDQVVPANHTVVLKMAIMFDDDTLETDKSVTLHAPELHLNSIRIDDTELGNGNHRADYGETFTCHLSIDNLGNMQAIPGTVFLTSSSDELILSTETLPTPTIDINGNVSVSFQATVNSDVQEPTTTFVKAVMYVNYYRIEANFPIKIGTVTEDWETGGFTHMNWQNNSGKPWTIVTTGPYEGTFCVRSGAIGNNNATTLRITDTATVADTISFYYKVSCEAYDKLTFRIDGQIKDEWGGITGWIRAAYPVEAGVHTYQWTYSKDYWGTDGQDRVLIDYISFPCGRVNHPVSVNEFVPNAKTLQVWPNPATNYVHVVTGDEGEDYIYRLYDLNGRLLQGGRLTENDTQINVSDYTSGTYILQVEDAQHHVQTAKIVKK